MSGRDKLNQLWEAFDGSFWLPWSDLLLQKPENKRYKCMCTRRGECLFSAYNQRFSRLLSISNSQGKAPTREMYVNMNELGEEPSLCIYGLKKFIHESWSLLLLLQNKILQRLTTLLMIFRLTSIFYVNVTATSNLLHNTYQWLFKCNYSIKPDNSK